MSSADPPHHGHGRPPHPVGVLGRRLDVAAVATPEVGVHGPSSSRRSSGPWSPPVTTGGTGSTRSSTRPVRATREWGRPPAPATRSEGTQYALMREWTGYWTLHERGHALGAIPWTPSPAPQRALPRAERRHVPPCPGPRRPGLRQRRPVQPPGPPAVAVRLQPRRLLPARRGLVGGRGQPVPLPGSSRPPAASRAARQRPADTRWLAEGHASAAPREPSLGVAGHAARVEPLHGVEAVAYGAQLGLQG